MFQLVLAVGLLSGLVRNGSHFHWNRLRFCGCFFVWWLPCWFTKTVDSVVGFCRVSDIEKEG